MSDAPSISQLLKIGITILEGSTVESPGVDAEILLSFVLSMDKLDLLTRSSETVEKNRVKEYLRAVTERKEGTPVQYITGKADFYNATLTVNENVLVPRPETEILVSSVLEEVCSGQIAPGGEIISILDVGTGSGAIALSLAMELSSGRRLKIIASDISDKALEIARRNSRDLGCGDLVEFRSGNMLDVLNDTEMFHIIVSNPPYVSCAEFETLPPEVRDHEPVCSLVSGETGLESIQTLLMKAKEHLLEGGLLALEIGLGQAEKVDRMLDEFGYSRYSFRKDLAGITRVVLARWEQRS